MPAETIGLSDAHLKIVREIISTHVPDREVMVFGSRACGKAKPYSDLDLVVMGETLLPEKVMRDLKDAFEESNLPFQVDIVEWAEISGQFRERIEQGQVSLTKLG